MPSRQGCRVALTLSLKCAGLVTIGDLKRSRRLLEIGCRACGRHVYVEAGGVGLSDTLPVSGVGARAWAPEVLLACPDTYIECPIILPRRGHCNSASGVGNPPRSRSDHCCASSRR